LARSEISGEFMPLVDVLPALDPVTDVGHLRGPVRAVRRADAVWGDWSAWSRGVASIVLLVASRRSRAA
jgi:hypothetical protein